MPLHLINLIITCFINIRLKLFYHSHYFKLHIYFIFYIRSASVNPITDTLTGEMIRLILKTVHYNSQFFLTVVALKNAN